MARTLKVYRMPVGFHDAYIAAPSQKAAVEAWGSDQDVFARGQAELVSDAALTEEPLASPGKVIKRLRGTAAEQIEALGKAEQPTTRKKAASPASAPKSVSKPPPSRAKLRKAEEALRSAGARHADELRDLAAREAEVARERRKIETAQKQEIERLNAAHDEQRAAYEAALRRWSG